MDWGVIAQAIFFLAIGFIAIIVTMFVFATSLLGLGVKKASSEKKTIQEEQKQKTSVELEKIQEQLNKAKQANNSQEVEKLGKEVSKLAKQLKMDEKSLASIPNRYSRPFTVGAGVAQPGIGFLLASILSGIAWSLFNRQPQVGIDFQNTFLLIGLAIIAIIYGVSRLYYNLKAIQEVAITSEEAVLGRMTEAVKTAYREYADENKPEMELEFREPKPPIQIVQGSTVTITFTCKLVNGDKGQDARVVFYAPKSFTFIPVKKKTSWARLLTYEDGSSIECAMGEDLYPSFAYYASVTMTAPQETGLFMFSYGLHCLGFTSQSKTFEVSVTPLTSLPKP